MNSLASVMPRLLNKQISVSQAAAHTKLSKRDIYKALRMHDQSSSRGTLLKRRQQLLKQLNDVDIALAQHHR